MDEDSGLDEIAKRLVEVEVEVEGELLETTEREFSAARRRLHMRIDFLRAHGNADGTPATPQQLEALDAEEMELSAARRALHAEIDERRRRKCRPNRTGR